MDVSPSTERGFTGSLISVSLQGAWQKLSSAVAECWLRIRTTGQVDPLTREGVHYTPLPYVMVFRMLRFLALQSDDVFVDIGCGKGRVLCCACRLPIKRVVGIEQNEELLQISRANLKSVRGACAPVELVHCSAEQYAYNDATVIYLYNPFNERITELVIDALHASYQRARRRMRIVYANPVHEQVMGKHGWLSKRAEWPETDFPGFGYSVSFWETIGPVDRATGYSLFPGPLAPGPAQR
jgi:precorrin-6B methylase 2